MEESIKDCKFICNRFVAYLDILGFKNMLINESHEDILEKFIKLKTLGKLADKRVDDLRDSNKSDTGIDIIIVSDSIIIFSKNDTIDSLIYVVCAANEILSKSLIDYDIPMKGGLAYGKITVPEDEIFEKDNIYFGQPIVDAYELQETTRYIGIVAHNSIDDYLKPFANDPTYCALFLKANTCFKKDNTCFEKEYSNTKWFTTLEDPNESSEEGINKYLKKDIIKILERMKLSAPDKAKDYYDNTLDFFNNYYNKVDPKQNE